MSTSLDKIVDLCNSEIVQIGQSFKDVLHKKLVLGQTRYVCRHGTLSDGHEKITPAQRYFQAIREMWYIANNVKDQEAQALLAQADLLDAQESLNLAEKESDKLRAKAKIQQAESSLVKLGVQIEDLRRMLDEYNKVRKELEPEVDAKYPEGIEQAEPENWMAVAKYRAMVENGTGQHQMLRHIPLAPLEKAKLGVEIGKPELASGYMAANLEQIEKLAGNNLIKFLEYQDKQPK